MDRRDFVKTGGIALTGLLAGCSQGSSETDGTNSENGTTGSTTTTESSSYSVSMAPMGEVTFESVPEKWIAYDGAYADMAVALGQADGITGIGYADRYYTYVYDELDGVNVDRSTLTENELLGDTIPKEPFYALENDVHLMDPKMLINWFGWSESDVEDIREAVAPFFGNLNFRREDEWHDYRYYTMYEAFGKLANLFKETERYEQFASLHDEFITKVQTQLPSAGERPNVLLTYAGADQPEQFSPYRITDKGTSKKQWHDLGVGDALAGTGIDGLSTSDRGKIDYESMLNVDPDVLLVRGHERKSAEEFRNTVLAYMRDHDVASKLSCVQNGRVYRGGFLHQGPIQNLFLTERAAQQLFPETFGEVTSDETLFDRGRVSEIVTGNF
ncbi:ABC transporter substrate-binding protein [Halomicroarcula sp. S1AR25-4]|uniref:ABC transporter substrate-binding protein n=1 Tax=Haloarcula sp. S1AR25-4 TaxID=2950538 RepID=UPI00287523AA|nr:ABC transporter substrate-binding protein [Halomicroarcula sp. S1AR25-4]MDS0276627.1 ABC transporter substrate-binding protein [Halomicroarcula sp. S1AR25-4]